MKKQLLVLLMVGSSAFASAEKAADSSIEQDFQGLGGNKVLLEKAKALSPDQEISIVQDRIVPRRKRWEISPEFAGTFGGDTYSRAQSLGLNIHYHINPSWSLGVKYTYDTNKLTNEGDAMVNKAVADAANNPRNPTAPVPTLDYPKTETFALVNWYPIYGKMNLLGKGIAHFDIYAVAGLGQVTLNSGPTQSYTGGAGVGFWWTRHFSSRLEMRYQNYKAQYFDHETNLDLGVASVQMGWLL
jgi:outer membrane beta-barrel protein